ncbi:hypothetical protein EDB81DRAFT_265495 [Dactylonectria macrodidyma]|uniref:Uncharacterized protein n=1 Tax=Dactylonectria macrodidyma TaxID=307937 RepID=A0A9P9JK37_9HYPO|nr:hypothetical protein EDB81DRAFT_265495 [Dactylonectria macrodidyma]
MQTSQESSPARISRHLPFPVDLRDESIKIIEDKEVVKQLSNIFPGTTDIAEARFRSYLNFTVKQMPKEPWPLTVGGVPITICTHTEGRGPLFPMNHLEIGRSANSICQNLDLREATISDQGLRSVAAELYQKIRSISPDVRLIEVIFASERVFYVVVGDETKLWSARNKLPGRIANCPAGYMHDHELNRPGWVYREARRNRLPEPPRGNENDGVSNVLRPGVIINSTKDLAEDHSTEPWTTSGVMVKDSAGHQYLTVASLGLGEEENVYQSLPGNQKRRIGKVVHEVPFTDVAMVELNDNFQFINETSENGGTATRIARLLGENPGDDFSMSAKVLINSHLTSHSLEGNMTMKSAKIERGPPTPSSGPTDDPVRYVVYSWVYIGQVDDAKGPICPPYGTCGSVILDEENLVIGFFRYCIREGRWAGFCASVSASEVVEAGYQLA